MTLAFHEHFLITFENSNCEHWYLSISGLCKKLNQYKTSGLRGIFYFLSSW